MKKYLINLVGENFSINLVTLLDYESKISKSLIAIKMSPNDIKEILIDTALVSGLNKYRFIKTVVDIHGNIDLNSLQYVSVNKGICKQANFILSKNIEFLENSILTSIQKEMIIKPI